MGRKAVVGVGVVVVDGAGKRVVRRDSVVGEEPLEIRVEEIGKEPVTVGVTMRTPGHDFDLAVGFLVGEGVLSGADVRRVEYCTRGIGVEQKYNIVTVTTTSRVDDRLFRRALVTSASCGICGTESIDALERQVPEGTIDRLSPRVDHGVLLSLPERLRAEQSVFEKTGGLHAAGLFTATGDVVVVREDIGRHNAVDKALGWYAMRPQPSLTPTQEPTVASVLVVSGRTSFEIVQKAAMSRIPIVAAVSAASSLAIDAAERFGITLTGFTRPNTTTIYTNAQRVT